jgi:hypothetical protein
VVLVTLFLPPLVCHYWDLVLSLPGHLSMFLGLLTLWIGVTLIFALFRFVICDLVLPLCHWVCSLVSHLLTKFNIFIGLTLWILFLDLLTVSVGGFASTIGLAPEFLLQICLGFLGVIFSVQFVTGPLMCFLSWFLDMTLSTICLVSSLTWSYLELFVTDGLLRIHLCLGCAIHCSMLRSSPTVCKHPRHDGINTCGKAPLAPPLVSLASSPVRLRSRFLPSQKLTVVLTWILLALCSSLDTAGAGVDGLHADVSPLTLDVSSSCPDLPSLLAQPASHEVSVFPDKGQPDFTWTSACTGPDGHVSWVAHTFWISSTPVKHTADLPLCLVSQPSLLGAPSMAPSIDDSLGFSDAFSACSFLVCLACLQRNLYLLTSAA